MSNIFSAIAWARLRRFAALLGVALAIAFGNPTPARAILQAVGELTYEQVDATTYRYYLRLYDTGTSNIGTLWYAWVPGEDYLPSAPTNVTAPAGWSSEITHSGAGDGYGIKYVAQTPLAPDGSLKGFSFDVPNTPDELAAASPFFPDTSVGTSVVYAGQPLVGASYEFIINPVANPWQNPFDPLDVNDDGGVFALDALLLINVLNSVGAHELTQPPPLSQTRSFLDTSGDHVVDALDALLVINDLNGLVGTSLAAPPAALAFAVPEPGSAALAFVSLATLSLLATCRRIRRGRPA